MQAATVLVKFVNPAKGKGPASIKDADGLYWKFWTNKIPMSSFHEGQTYQIGYKEETYENVVSRTILAVGEIPTQAPAAPRLVVAQAARPLSAPIPAHLSYMPLAQPAPAAGGQGGNKDRLIYEQTLLKAFIGTGAIDNREENLVENIKMFQRVFDRTH